MASYTENCFHTSLGDFVNFKKINPDDYELESIVSEGEDISSSIDNFNKKTKKYDYIVDFREEHIITNQGGFFLIIGKMLPVGYHILRGTGIYKIEKEDKK